MKQMVWVYGIWIMAIVGAICGTVGAQNLTIQSFNANGEVTFNEISTATVYRVEWAPNPSGPWTNSWDALATIQATGSGIVTCSVPMVYRVVAEVTNTPIPAMVAIAAGSNIGTNPLAPGESYNSFYPESYSLTVDAFYMDTTEVSKTQWDAVYTWAITNGYSFDNAGSGKAADHPVDLVNWYDCVKWCNARSEKDDLTPCYTVSGSTYKTGQSTPDCNFTANGYRLPTNDEWEYAARSGLVSKRFPLGDNIQHAVANYFSSTNYVYDTSATHGFHPLYAVGSLTYTSPVGSFPPNGYGLYDMAGNVWEWCNDSTGLKMYYHGSGFSNSAINLRCGGKYSRPPYNSANDLGFRSVRR